MDLKKTVTKKMMELMTDPRVAKLLADPRVMKAVMTAMTVPGKVSTFTAESVEKIAKATKLASGEEVEDLKRHVARLEDEIEELRRERDQSKR